MQEGTIVRLNPRGFGFITPADGGKDVFFHAREVKNTQYNDLREGEKVTFDVVNDGPKGPSAINVNRAA